MCWTRRATVFETQTVSKMCIRDRHRINEDVVLSLVSEMLKAIAEYAKHDRAEFVRVVQEAQSLSLIHISCGDERPEIRQCLGKDQHFLYRLQR